MDRVQTCAITRHRRGRSGRRFAVEREVWSGADPRLPQSGPPGRGLGRGDGRALWGTRSGPQGAAFGGAGDEHRAEIKRGEKGAPSFPL